MGESASASVALAEQVRVVDVTTPVLGEMLTLVISGSVFSTATEALSESVPAWGSVAVAVQVIWSPGELVDVVSVRLASVPRLVPSVSLDHA